MPSIYDFVHKLFEDSQGNNFRPPEDGDRTLDPVLDWNENDDLSSAVKIFTDPFQVQQLFERQMEEFNNMVQNMAINMEDFFRQGPVDPFQSPPVEAPTVEGSDPRKHWLKPDKDLNDRPKTSSWLDIFLPPHDKDSQHQPRVFSSFSSVTRRTVRLPDGTMKTEEIIRKPDGTEERTESETLPDERMSPSHQTPFISPGLGISDFLQIPKLTKPESEIDLFSFNTRDQFLKPGYETLNPRAEKVDKDLDSQVQLSGLSQFPNEPKTKQPENGFTFKSVTRKTVTLPNGVTETEEIVRNSDGTHQRTVSHTSPDGTNLIQAPDSFQKDSNAPFGYEKNIEDSRSFAFKGVKNFLDMIFK